MRQPKHLRNLTVASDKDLALESEWAELNELLEPTEQALIAGHTAPKRPTVFILGPQRSGSTLLSQVLAATGAFAVTTNLVAHFWRAPAFGMRLAKALNASSAPPSFNSERGRTLGDSEPHEFGYFWSSWMDLGQETHLVPTDLRATIDQAALRQSLAGMEAAAGLPLMFKNNTWFTFQADWLAKLFPMAVFVVSDRDPFFIAQSILSQRRSLGDENAWWSVRPETYPDLLALPPLEQIAAQTVDIQHEMETALQGVPENRLIRVDYTSLCRTPQKVAARVLETCAALGDCQKSIGTSLPEEFATTDRVRLPASEETELRRHLTARQSLYKL